MWDAVTCTLKNLSAAAPELASLFYRAPPNILQTIPRASTGTAAYGSSPRFMNYESPVQTVLKRRGETPRSQIVVDDQMGACLYGFVPLLGLTRVTVRYILLLPCCALQTLK